MERKKFEGRHTHTKEKRGLVLVLSKGSFLLGYSPCVQCTLFLLLSHSMQWSAATTDAQCHLESRVKWWSCKNKAKRNNLWLSLSTLVLSLRCVQPFSTRSVELRGRPKCVLNHLQKLGKEGGTDSLSQRRRRKSLHPLVFRTQSREPQQKKRRGP